MGDVQHPLVLIRDEALARSCGPAPITAVASALISCWSTHSRLARMVSVISPALSAASSSDRSDSLRATGTRLLREPWQEHVETHAGGPPNGWTLTPTYTTSRDTNGEAVEPVTPYGCSGRSECGVVKPELISREVRAQMTAALAWGLAIGSFVVPLGLLFAPVLLALGWLHRRTGRVPVAPVALASNAYVAIRFVAMSQ